MVFPFECSGGRGVVEPGVVHVVILEKGVVAVVVVVVVVLDGISWQKMIEQNELSSRLKGYFSQLPENKNVAASICVHCFAYVYISYTIPQA